MTDLAEAALERVRQRNGSDPKAKAQVFMSTEKKEVLARWAGLLDQRLYQVADLAVDCLVERFKSKERELVGLKKERDDAKAGNSQGQPKSSAKVEETA